MELIVARIKHIITVPRHESEPGLFHEETVFTYAEDELDDMLAHLRALDAKGKLFEHRWEVVSESPDG